MLELELPVSHQLWDEIVKRKPPQWLLATIIKKAAWLADDASELSLQMEPSGNSLSVIIENSEKHRDAAKARLNYEIVDDSSDDEFWYSSSFGIVFVDRHAQSNRRTLQNETDGHALSSFVETGECHILGFSTHPYFYSGWVEYDWCIEFFEQEHESVEQRTRRFARYWDFETILNQAHLNPKFKSVQLVGSPREALAEVEVECQNGQVLRGSITWVNSD